MSDVNNLIKETMNEIYDNNYNILVPKKIKLSKLLEKLNDTEIYGDDDNDFAINRYDENCFSVDNKKCLLQYFDIEHRYINHMSYGMKNKKYKWIFLLWVANTEIIDDLKEVENEI